jgi:hypothetical protein
MFVAGVDACRGGWVWFGVEVHSLVTEVKVVDLPSVFRNRPSDLILLDQPMIVTNSTGQRPVEKIVGSAVSLRYGGMQPANTSRAEMFGPAAPLWPFLSRFGVQGKTCALSNQWGIASLPIVDKIAAMLPPEIKMSYSKTPEES